jgi:hypothetical protein
VVGVVAAAALQLAGVTDQPILVPSEEEIVWSDMRAGIYTTLGMLMMECKLRGESGTEIFMKVLAEAIRSVMEQWSIVEAYRNETGQFFDCNEFLSAED